MDAIAVLEAVIDASSLARQVREQALEAVALFNVLHKASDHLIEDRHKQVIESSMS